MYTVALDARGSNSANWHADEKIYDLRIHGETGEDCCVRSYRSFNEFTKSNVYEAFVCYTQWVTPTVLLLGRMGGQAPTTYEELCRRLGIHSEEEDAWVNTLHVSESGEAEAAEAEAAAEAAEAAAEAARRRGARS